MRRPRASSGASCLHRASWARRSRASTSSLIPASTQEIDDGEPCGLDASPDEIITAIQNAGIVGLGGAAFPTHVKLKPPEGKKLDTLFINGVECEPYLTTDYRVMLEQTEDVFAGIRYLLRATGTSEVIIAIEANKLDAAERFRTMCPDDLPVSVRVSPVKYPQGAEKMIFSALLGREVPSGGLPADIGAICCNVATTAEIGRLLPRGRGIQERVITIGGPGVRKKGQLPNPDWHAGSLSRSSSATPSTTSRACSWVVR